MSFAASPRFRSSDWHFVLWVDNAGAAPDIKEAREISRSIIARCKHRQLALASVSGPWRRRSQRAVPATTDLVEKLRAQKVAFEELIIPDEIHNLLRWNDWVRAYRAIAEFFDRNVAASGERK